MQLQYRPFDLQLTHVWTVAHDLGRDGQRGDEVDRVIFLELEDDGLIGMGEAAPFIRYNESPETVIHFLRRVDPARLSSEAIDDSMRYLDTLADGEWAAKGALNIALWDLAAQKTGQPLYDLLQLGFQEGKHITSFSIGIDSPDAVRRKVREADEFPILKMKLGSASDRESWAALREAAPDKPVRVDGNEAWKPKEEALRQIEWLANDPRVQFVEQPMPASLPLEDWAWLKERSPLPLMADESYRSAEDVEFCSVGFHAVNVKLAKTGGVSGARAALEAARAKGLKTMLGCMIESSILITAAAHLAELTDYLDLDGNLLVTNDPFRGVTAERGRLSFAFAPRPFGLRTCPRTAS